MKHQVWVDFDEHYPVFYFGEKSSSPYTPLGARVVEVEASQVARWNRISQEYKEMQEELRKLSNYEEMQEEQPISE